MALKSTDYKRKYNEENYDRLYITVPIGQKSEIENIAKSKGYKSYNDYINKLILQDKAKD